MSSVARSRRVATRYLRRARVGVHRALLRWPRRVACPACGWSGARLAADARGVPNRLCPSCGCSERDRACALDLIAAGPVAPGSRLLEVAPIGVVRTLAERLGYEYHSVDLWSPVAEVRADLCSLPFGDARFDLVVCFHVLEHVVDDRSAVRELARVVRSDGGALVVVPLDRGTVETFEDPETPPSERERVYGQSDHVRIYGTDVADRWRAAGVDVEESFWSDRFTSAERARASLDYRDDRFWIVRPGAPGP